MTASVHGGASSSEAGTRAVVGGALTWRVTERVEVEVAPTWFTGGRWSRAFVASAAARMALGRGGWADPVVPFLSAGAGFHRATVTLADPRVLGPIPGDVPSGASFCAGSGRGPGTGVPLGGSCAAGQSWGVGDLPDFYSRRLGTLVVPADRQWPDRTFQDPAFMFGGGVRIGGDSGLFIQPEARVWMVVADGRTRASALGGIAVGIAF